MVVCVCVVLLWWCVCVWCVVKLGTLSRSLVLFSFPFFFSLSLSFSLLSFFFFLLIRFHFLLLLLSLLLLLLFFIFLFFLLSSLLLNLLFSSLHANKHCTKHWSTNTASNFEAFECDVAHGTFIATANELHGMFPPLLLPPLLSFPPLPSLLPPSLHQKKRTVNFFYYMNISGEGIVLYYSFILIQKNQRRVNLQSLQFLLIRKQ